MKKILICGMNYFHYINGLLNAVNSLGHVAKINYVKPFEKEKLNKVDYLLYKFSPKRFIDHYFIEQRSILLKEMEQCKYDYFISYGVNSQYEILDRNILLNMKKGGVKLISIYGDAYSFYHGVEQNLDMFDRVFVFEPADVSLLREKGINAEYLPIGVADELFYNERVNKNFVYDVSFVGRKTQERLNILEKIARYCSENGRSFAVFGMDFWKSRNFIGKFFKKRKFKVEYPFLFNCIQDRNLYGTELAILYDSSKININIHVIEHKSINPRTFEILCNDNFVLSDYREDAEEMGFYDGKNIAMYSDAEDCISKIEYYLNNETLRNSIAVHGGELVREKYTMKKLLEGIIE